MNSRSPACRPGYSLLELIVVMSVGSIIGTTAIMLLGALLAADRGARAHLQESASLSRLSRQFRADVAAAEDASIEMPSATKRDSPERSFPRLTLHGASGETITYVGEPGRAVRKAQGESGADRQESYALPEPLALTFEIDSMSSQRILTMSLAAGDDQQTSSVRLGWRVEAALGRDRRHADALRPHGQQPGAGKETAP